MCKVNPEGHCDPEQEVKMPVTEGKQSGDHSCEERKLGDGRARRDQPFGYYVKTIPYLLIIFLDVFLQSKPPEFEIHAYSFSCFIELSFHLRVYFLYKDSQPSIVPNL